MDEKEAKKEFDLHMNQAKKDFFLIVDMLSKMIKKNQASLETAIDGGIHSVIQLNGRLRTRGLMIWCLREMLSEHLGKRYNNFLWETAKNG